MGERETKEESDREISKQSERLKETDMVGDSKKTMQTLKNKNYTLKLIFAKCPP